MSYFYRSLLQSSLGLLTILSTQKRCQLFLDAFSVDGEEENGYILWNRNNRTNYEHYTYLKRDGVDVDAAFHWSIFHDEKVIKTALITKSSGWSAFGIAESGGMPGADIAVFTLSEDEDGGVLRDYHATAYAHPTIDESQDWKLNSYFSTNDGFLIWEGERLLDTGDVHGDHIILNDAIDPSFPATKIIVAWGDSLSLSYHGSNKVKGEVRLFGDDDSGGDNAEKKLIQQLEDESDGRFYIGAAKYKIPSQETMYAHFCVSYEDLISSGLPDYDETNVHIIGFQPIIDKTPYVHHMLIRTTENDNVVSCNTNDISSILHLWAFGGKSSLLPTETGFKLGPIGIKRFLVEIHYNNVNKVDRVVDSSGFKVYWTKSLRQHDAGTLEIADPLVRLGGSNIGNGLSRHSFLCPSTCTSTTFREDVTVFAELLHMHQKGAMMKNEQLRENHIVRKSVVEYYDFQQSGAFLVPQERYTIKAGDSFRTECYYRTNSGDVKFGLASTDEMCIAYIFYFSRQSTPSGKCAFDWDVRVCSSEHSETLLNNENDFNRVFGSTNASSSLPYQNQADSGNDPNDGIQANLLFIISSILGGMSFIVFIVWFYLSKKVERVSRVVVPSDIESKTKTSRNEETHHYEPVNSS